MYKSIEVRISLENAGFDDNSSDIEAGFSFLSEQIDRHLYSAALGIDVIGECHKLIDSNGNTVGYVKLIETEEEPTCSC